MVAAAEKNIEWFQGDTFDYTVRWLDSNEDPVDLTGYTARMQLRASYDATSDDLTLTTENGRIYLGGTTGEVRLIVDAATMAALTAGSYKYDLELVQGATVRKLLYGKFKVLPEVTKV